MKGCAAPFAPVKRSNVACRLSTGYTSRPSTTAASAAFSLGTMMPVRPSSRARMAMGRTPRTGRTVPSSANSPMIQKRSSRSCTMASPEAAKRPTASGRSNAAPSLRTSAGARLMVTAPRGTGSPLVLMAARMRSRLSRTAPCGSPTTV